MGTRYCEQDRGEFSAWHDPVHAALRRQPRLPVHRTASARTLWRGRGGGLQGGGTPGALRPHAAALKAEIDKHGLTQLGINTFVGSRPGDFGLGAVPGRERDWDIVFKQALDYTVAIGGSAIHCMAGIVPPEQRPAAERTFIANLTRAADLAREHNVTCLIEPINRATGRIISSPGSSRPPTSLPRSASPT